MTERYMNESGEHVQVAVTQTLADAIDTLHEARHEADDVKINVVFVTTEGTEYVTGLFEICDLGTHNQRVVVDLRRVVASD